MKRIVICPNPRRDVGLRYSAQAAAVLQAAGLTCTLCYPFEDSTDASVLGLPLLPLQQAIRSADCMVCLGGDGTILRVAKHAAQRSLPLATINLGNLGFICELGADEIATLSQLAGGKYRIDSRMMLDVSVLRGGSRVYTNLALNEAVINKGAVSRVIGLRVKVGGYRLFDTRGDGLIVATATGSTGYSLSAGGPIVEPSSRNMIVTPICAHNARLSPYVLAPGDVITVEPVEKSRNGGYLCVDGGRIFALRPGDVVELRRSRFETQLIRFFDRSFYEECDRKMMTGGFRYEK